VQPATIKSAVFTSFKNPICTNYAVCSTCDNLLEICTSKFFQVTGYYIYEKPDLTKEQKCGIIWLEFGKALLKYVFCRMLFKILVRQSI
jgi:hypothetical protein